MGQSPLKNRPGYFSHSNKIWNNNNNNPFYYGYFELRAQIRTRNSFFRVVPTACSPRGSDNARCWLAQRNRLSEESCCWLSNGRRSRFFVCYFFYCGRTRRARFAPFRSPRPTTMTYYGSKSTFIGFNPNKRKLPLSKRLVLYAYDKDTGEMFGRTPSSWGKPSLVFAPWTFVSWTRFATQPEFESCSATKICFPGCRLTRCSEFWVCLS